jgi:hypothetical protein
LDIVTTAHQPVRLKTLFLFAFIGPFIGSLPLAVAFAGVGLIEKGNPAFALVAFVFAYPVGFIPAIVSGTLYIFTSPYLLRCCPKYPKICACILGVFCGLGGGVILAYFLSQGQKDGIDYFSNMYMLSSMLAGGACGILSLRLTPSSTSVVLSKSKLFRWLMALGVVIIFFVLISISSN